MELKELNEQISRLYSNYKKTSSERHTVSYLETRKELLEDYWQQFTTEYRNIKLEPTLTKETKKEYKELFIKMEDVYLDFKTSIKENIINLSKKPNNDSPSSSLTQTRLPLINLPTFSGNYNEWLHFKDMFQSLIHNESGISDVQKHHYLRSSLRGEAEQLLRHLDITASNYQQAWKTLSDRYSNKRILVNNLINRLLNQRKLICEDSKALKELINTTTECLNSLTSLDIDVKTWDPIIIHIVVNKLDLETHKCWEQSLGSTTELPKLSSLTTFLEGRFRAMEMVQNTTHRKERKDSPLQITKTKQIKSFNNTTEKIPECTYCKKSHYISHCSDFTQIDVEQRREFVKNHGLCYNCLVKGHTIKFCRQHTNCRVCHKKHHTLLHTDTADVTAKPAVIDVANTENGETQFTTMKISIQDSQVVLATARIAVRDRNGSFVYLRALVDQGSQATFITESIVQLLGLKKRMLEAKITGIGNQAVQSRQQVSFDIYSPQDSTHVTRVNAHVLSKLTPILPSRQLDITQWSGVKDLKFSDPNFDHPGPIDVLLGADVYAAILLDGLHKHGTLIAQNTRLGWLLSGVTPTKLKNATHNNIVVTTALIEIHSLLRKFWETEEYQQHDKPLTNLEQECENYYRNTVKRQDDGRYIVRLPFQDSHEVRLGNSRKIAQDRLIQMEKRFYNKPKFQEDYKDFIDEYQRSDHMEDIDPNKKPNHKIYYLPHHAVIRESSTTTKLRVVFDGTAKPNDGTSLNDELLIGPSLQRDIKDLIIRWRTHRICLISDIKQMYRQIRVSNEDADYQRILWRPSPTDEITEKRLLTVTYGTSCAPFLAIRTLKQLAIDERENFPDLFDIINNDIFMDDLLTGANDELSARNLQNRMSQIMAKGGFQMHKWASNSPEVLKDIPNSIKLQGEDVNIQIDDTIKALGIKWNSKRDVLELKLDVSLQTKPYTKTSVLSDIARAFDPLGFLGPVIITAKIFLQKLWLSGIGWTDELPPELMSEWTSYRNQLLNMKTISLNRWLYTEHKETEKVEIHGFCDASCLAYAAVVYLRVITVKKIYVSILIAKTRVAPVKQISLPRLELCGAVLLAKLIRDVKSSLRIKDESIFAWTDSTIVLSWLRKNPNVWKTYVANRTTEILNVVDSNRWRHIKSNDNPSDCASRGLNPEFLREFDVWWHGPLFLRESEGISYPQPVITETDVEIKPNLKSVISLNVMVCEREVLTHLTRFSDLSKLVRVTAYMFRFVQLCKAKANAHSAVKLPNYLTVNELRNARYACVRISQSLYFSDEIKLLQKEIQLPKTSKLKSLCPLIDRNGIVRTLGRLHNAPICNDSKSPIVIHSKCPLAALIAKDAHLQALHGGINLTLNVIRVNYWIIGARNLVKKVINKCLPCFKHSAAPISQLMGQLPISRVTPAKPFRCSGVDYAGPVNLKLYPGRCLKTCKAYICLFVCMVTKAIHLELVTDLSSSAFLAAFRRFISRRGHCSDLWSDCATNFVGASKELDNMFNMSKSEVLGEILANFNTTWHFIPPGSPHMGGLWEAGVKSVKTHLKRVIGETRLTFEEYYTLLTQVETCVNSRPLTVPSDSLDENISPITPGHFLIGEAPITVPEPNLEDLSLSHLERWQMIQKMLQNLWSRWSSEYLHTLQKRFKWTDKVKEPGVGCVVLVKDERLPPGKWILARVLEKHPGKDGLTRVVSLKMKGQIFKRPITKICPLSTTDDSV